MDAVFVITASTTAVAVPGEYYEVVTDGSPGVRVRFLVPAGDPVLLGNCLFSTNYTHQHPYGRLQPPGILRALPLTVTCWGVGPLFRRRFDRQLHYDYPYASVHPSA